MHPQTNWKVFTYWKNTQQYLMEFRVLYVFEEILKSPQKEVVSFIFFPHIIQTIV